MRIDKNKFSLANKVLKELGRKEYQSRFDTYLYAFANGREQGYTILASYPGTVAVSFAENRSSDDIVVYVRPTWSMYEDILTESEGETRKYFAGNEIGIKDACRHITKSLNVIA